MYYFARRARGICSVSTELFIESQGKHKKFINRQIYVYESLWNICFRLLQRNDLTSKLSWISPFQCDEGNSEVVFSCCTSSKFVHILNVFIKSDITALCYVSLKIAHLFLQISFQLDTRIAQNVEED